MRSINERLNNQGSASKQAAAAMASKMHVAAPGIIQSFNADAQTCTVQLAVRERIRRNGTVEDTTIPLLLDVPIVLPRAGGCSLLMRPKTGDECLVVFSDLCIDAWWQSGGIQNQASPRRHDLSDGFAILGTWSQPVKPAFFPDSGMILQDENGKASIHIDGDTVHISGKLLINGSPYDTHRHKVSDGDTATGGLIP